MAVITKDRVQPKDHGFPTRALLIGAGAVVAAATGVYLVENFALPALHNIIPSQPTPSGFPAGGPQYHGPQTA